MKLVYLEWEDAKSKASWHDEEQLEEFLTEPFIVRSLGFILRENDKRIALCGEFHPGSETTQANYGNLLVIPKTWIRKRKIIKL